MASDAEFLPRIMRGFRRTLYTEAIAVAEDKTPVLRLEPEKRLCPEYAAATIARYRIAAPGEMGFRVLDNFCEEHIQ